MNKIVSIPREMSKQGELVIIPREDYEEFLRLQKVVPLVEATASEKKAIREGRKQIQEGKYITLKELENELEG